MSNHPQMPAYLVGRSFCSIADERVPEGAPEPKAYVGFHNSPEEIERIGKNVRILAYLSYDLIEYAWRLAETSWERRGGYDEGSELPTSSRAAAAGAIALAYAALEAAINEQIVNLEGMLRDNGDAVRARLARLVIGLSLRDRLDAVAAIYGHAIEWGTEPTFQRFELLVAVRNHLLHHELGGGLLVEGYWPAKRLRDLPNQIKSPYRSRKDLHWYDHVLAPAGAVWAVNVACEVLSALEHWWNELRPPSRGAST
ncbi:MAG: hypothetical protein HYY11_01290 [Candidatus Methylomirabilis oxyfera]|nr:hypothetical protein [Candidatus Methylomirabilis oxyfera]